MLILTRRIGETVYIGDDVQVTILKINGRQVHMGITAPTDTPVHRKEIYERIKKEREAGTNPTGMKTPKEVLGLRVPMFLRKQAD